MNAQPSTISPTSSPYNALNGHELLNVIMQKVYHTLQHHQDFSEAITYPKYRYKVTVELTVPELNDELRASTIPGESLDPITGRTVELSHTISQGGSPAPDQDRHDSGQPLPRPKMTSGGIVDIPTR